MTLLFQINRLPGRPIPLAALPILLGLLCGCGGGGQDYGGFNRSLDGDIGTSYDTSLSSRYGNSNKGGAANVIGRGTYPKIETAFHLPNLKGDPFDYEKVNIQVTLRKPDGGTVDMPAFFDGGNTWRMRYTPTAPGNYSVVTVKLNGQTTHEEQLEKKEWTVGGDSQPGFIRVDRGDHNRFVFDNGGRYFPLGHDQAWHSNGLPDIPELFAKMGKAGENWSRVWMVHWGGTNLDWSASEKRVKPGEIDLEAAKRWDTIIDSAEKNGIYFQMTLQHHGQYSSAKGYRYSNNNNANWEENPYNVKNGGFLQNPEDFFTNPQARALTKRKLYYILARWGYSPNVMAWELFNEVEGTDAGSGKLWDDIAMWHREMALFLRQYDGYHHLITTSAYPGIPLDNPVWQTVDYYQQHAYPTDLITALGGTDATGSKRLDKPFFVGEFGPSALQDPQGVSLHAGLWASLMSGRSGAAEYWMWDAVEKNDLYGQYQSASAFLTASGLANHGDLVSAAPAVETSEKAALQFGPGGGWETATQNEFVVGANGPPSGFSKFPAFLQGQAHHEMMPKPLTFQVSYAQPGDFVVQVKQVAKAGAHLKISVDGGKAVERDYPSAAADYPPRGEQGHVQIDVPAGAHTLVIENTGKDWLVPGHFRFSNYASALAVLARSSKEYAVAWVYHRENVEAPADKEEELKTATGKLTLAGLQKGRYRVTWWDTHAGKSLDEAELTVEKDKEGATLITPPIKRDLAFYIVKASTPPPDKRKEKKPAAQARFKPGA